MTTIITKESGNRKLPFDKERLKNYYTRVTGMHDIDYVDKVVSAIESRKEYSAKGIIDLSIKTALENIDEANPEWTFVASKIFIESLYKQASINRAYSTKDKYGDYYGLQKVLASKGIYSHHILEKYSRDEINQAGKMIDSSKDSLFDYAGIHLLTDRYLAKDYEGNIYELPQERWLTIAMFLMQDEPQDKRMTLVEQAYWALSNLYMTVATPTLANAGKVGGQLSSCFIDTVDDSLEGIYNSNSDIAQVSKFGGGVGVYLGKIRARGSSIRGHKGASSGVIPWIRQLNNTAVSVDQLGTRSGAIAVYLDVWHSDIMDFLDVKLNNGDQRMRAHDIFPAVSLPDLFMEQVEKRGDWYLFDPHEVREVMGYSIEDYYDEERGSGTFREKYEECIQNNKLTKTKVPAIDIMKRIMISQLETGTPFMFYRDEVNRMNPNKDKGVIYSSNLCMEVTQNQSPTTVVKEEVKDGLIVTYKESGDFVVCNLSSINLGRAVPDNVLEKLIPIQVRMLDNVIDLNNLPVKQAQITNEKYRAIGIGTLGLHHLMALKEIQWETDEAVEFNDKLYEKIAYLSIKSSMELAKEKGAYPLFKGSEWNTGEYFNRRGYIDQVFHGKTDNNWVDLKEDVAKYGVRNAYIQAVAPNMSTATIAGSTASIDPIFNVFYHEEKKDYKIPVTAPDLNHITYNVYRKTTYMLDQFWSIKQNAARQRHVDQAISFNLYVPSNIRASVLLDLHLEAWKEGLKTTYYVRSTSTNVEECEWCSS